jgi:hypothetical protein
MMTFIVVALGCVALRWVALPDTEAIAEGTHKT